MRVRAIPAADIGYRLKAREIVSVQDGRNVRVGQRGHRVIEKPAMLGVLRKIPPEPIWQ